MNDLRLRQYLKENSILISLIEDKKDAQWTYYSIVENNACFDELYSRFPLNSIETVDDFYEYLFAKKLVSLETSINDVKNQDDKEFILGLLEGAKATLSKLKIGDAVKFINANCAAVIEQGFTPDLFISATIAFMANMGSGIEERAIIQLCEKIEIGIISYYAQLEGLLNRFPNAFEIAFQSQEWQQLGSSAFNDMLEVWRSILQKGNSPLKSIVENLLSKLHEYMVNTAASLKIDTVGAYANHVNDYYRFLIKIKNPNANEFKALVNRTNKLIDEWVTRDGFIIKQEIPVSEVLSALKSTDDSVAFLLNLTHTIDSSFAFQDGSHLSVHAEENPINRLLHSNVVTDDYYNVAHQQSLDIIAKLRSILFVNFLSDGELTDKYVQGVGKIMSFVGERLCSDNENYLSDQVLLLNIIMTVNKHIGTDSEIFAIVCYGAAMYTCAMVEKLLRLAYLHFAGNEVFVPEDGFSLGTMLNNGYSMLTNVFSIEHLKNLSYFLIKSADSKIGKNIRNNLAHWSSISQDQLTPYYFARILWLFTDVLNSVFIYLIKEEDLIAK